MYLALDNLAPRLTAARCPIALSSLTTLTLGCSATVGSYPSAITITSVTSDEFSITSSTVFERSSSHRAAIITLVSNPNMVSFLM